MTDEGIEQRRICWPDFDKTCLEGGCHYCNRRPFRSTKSIEIAVQRGKGRGTVEEMRTAFDYGLRHNWTNAESRRLRVGLGERPTCKCGCGELTERNDRQWIPGHLQASKALGIPPARQMELALGATPQARKIEP